MSFVDLDFHTLYAILSAILSQLDQKKQSPLRLRWVWIFLVAKGCNHIPGDSIRPVDPIVSDRIRVGFYRNPTFSIKSRSDPIAII